MNVDGRIYGPYSTDQMKAFVAQKRLAYHSLVAPAGSGDFRPALQHPELKPLFSAQRTPAAARGPADEGARLVVFGSEAGARAAADALDEARSVHPLSASAFLVVTTRTTEELRDRISRHLPSTERLIVLNAGSEVASHGVSLTEHQGVSEALSSRPRQS